MSSMARFSKCTWSFPYPRLLTSRSEPCTGFTAQLIGEEA
jgi:hypothetical protein